MRDYIPVDWADDRRASTTSSWDTCPACSPALQGPGDGLSITAGAVLIALAGDAVRGLRLRLTVSRPVEGAPETQVAAPPADEIRPRRRRAA